MARSSAHAAHRPWQDVPNKQGSSPEQPALPGTRPTQGLTVTASWHKKGTSSLPHGRFPGADESPCSYHSTTPLCQSHRTSTSTG